MIGDRIQLCGDDLFVTQPRTPVDRAQKGAANSIPDTRSNQIGTPSETLDAAKLAHLPRL